VWYLGKLIFLYGDTDKQHTELIDYLKMVVGDIIEDVNIEF